MPNSTDPASVQQTLTLKQALDLGLQHHTEGELSKAENIYQQILQTAPNHPDALHLLGMIRHQAGEYDRAVDLITKALAIKPDFAEAHSNLGLTLQELGQLEEAVTCYHKTLAIKPDFAGAHTNLGLALQALGQLEDAVDQHREAINITPNNVEAHYNLGLALHELGQLEEAVIHYLKAIEIKPDFINAHNNLGNALHELKRLDQAISHYYNAIDIGPDNSEVHHNLGFTLQLMGKLDEAVASYRKAIAINPDYSDAHCNLGSALRASGRLDEAINCFERANTTVSRADLLECVYALGEKDRFYQLLEKIILEDKTNRGVAAISAFASNQFGCHDPYPFCKSPMEYVYVNNIVTTTDKESGLLHEIQKQIANLKLDGKLQALLKSGMQSSGNLFLEPLGALAELDKIIRIEIAAYGSKFQAHNCCFIKMWPRKYTLKGWYILMEKGGHLKSHNHPQGWLSGVLYLKMPPTNSDEGYIEFSLHKENFPILDSDFPKELYKVKEGDLVMFPSSLFHRTIPFYSEEERLCIAFDLAPIETDVYA